MHTGTTDAAVLQLIRDVINLEAPSMHSKQAAKCVKVCTATTQQHGNHTATCCTGIFVGIIVDNVQLLRWSLVDASKHPNNSSQCASSLPQSTIYHTKSRKIRIKCIKHSETVSNNISPCFFVKVPCPWSWRRRWSSLDHSDLSPELGTARHSSAQLSTAQHGSTRLSTALACFNVWRS